MFTTEHSHPKPADTSSKVQYVETLKRLCDTEFKYRHFLQFNPRPLCASSTLEFPRNKNIHREQLPVYQKKRIRKKLAKPQKPQHTENQTYLNTDTATDAELLGDERNFGSRGNLNTELPCKTYPEASRSTSAKIHNKRSP